MPIASKRGKMPKTNNNLNTLGAQLKADLKLFSVKTNELAKKVAYQVLSDLTENTVVDTSKAVSNWQVSNKRPTRGDIQAHEVGSRGSTADASISATKFIGDEIINNKKSGEPLFIVNNINKEDYVSNAGLLVAEDIAETNAIIAIASAKVLLSVR